MNRINWPLVWAVIVMSGLIAFLYSVPVHARDAGQWEGTDPAIREWYESLKQPDTGISCCGPSDSYFCDERAEGAQVYCIIDDDRSDEELKRRHVDNGTRVDIPPNKMNHDPNIVGHAVVFLSSNNYVWCFISIGGV